MNPLGRISVIGLGKLGAPFAAALAWKGFQTIGLDVDSAKVETLNRGIAPVYEPRLKDLIKSTKGFLKGTQDYEEAINQSEITFILVPTPSEEGGSFSLKYVLQAAQKIGEILRYKRDYHLVVLTSTVMPGSTEGKVRAVLQKYSRKKCGEGFGLCYNPEFVALGSVVHDLLNPDFILIGESDKGAGDKIEQLYRKFCENNPPVTRMNFVNAELTKLAVNSFVTTKISFANMLARFCERLSGADVDVVTAALGLDSRIGKRYLKGAIGYGGPCFPRDNRALAALGHSLNVPTVLPEATNTFNRKTVTWLADLVVNKVPEKVRVGILGLAYKPNSDVIEESQGMFLARTLIKAGKKVIVYDPVAIQNAKRVLLEKVSYADSTIQCVGQSDVVIVMTPWEEFRHLKLSSFARPRMPRILIDCWRLYYDQKDQMPPGLKYQPLGVWPSKKGHQYSKICTSD